MIIPMEHSSALHVSAMATQTNATKLENALSAKIIQLATSVNFVLMAFTATQHVALLKTACLAPALPQTQQTAFRPSVFLIRMISQHVHSAKSTTLAVIAKSAVLAIEQVEFTQDTANPWSIQHRPSVFSLRAQVCDTYLRV